MSYLAVDLAIFERLVGAPINSAGLPVTDQKGVPVNRLLFAPPLHPDERLPSYGVRIPMLSRKRDTTNVFSSMNPNSIHPNDFSRTSFRQVKVFPENITGQDYQNVWPTVTFYWLGEVFNSSTYVYADPFEIVDPTSPERTVMVGDKTVTGPHRRKYLTHPDPYDLYYTIRVWSKDMVELRLLCESVKQIFPSRGALEVERADGTKMTLDMLLESIDNYDLGREEVAVMGEQEQRAYSRGFTYRIESYVDNTIDQHAMWVEGTVKQRILELVQLQKTTGDDTRPIDLTEVETVE